MVRNKACFGINSKIGAKYIAILGIILNTLLFIGTCTISQSFYDTIFASLKNSEVPLLFKYFDWILGMSVTFSLVGILMNSMLLFGLQKKRRIFMLPWIMWTLTKLVVSSILNFHAKKVTNFVFAFRSLPWLVSVNLSQLACLVPLEHPLSYYISR